VCVFIGSEIKNICRLILMILIIVFKIYHIKMSIIMMVLSINLNDAFKYLSNTSNIGYIDRCSIISAGVVNLLLPPFKKGILVLI